MLHAGADPASALAAHDALVGRGVAAGWHLGEGAGALAALAAAGAVDADDALRLADVREALVAAADDERPGATAGIVGLDDELVSGLCAMAVEDAWLARYDAPRHVTVAGTHGGVRAVARAAEGEGGRVEWVTRGPAVHGAHMASVAAPLGKALAGVEWWRPAAPVLSELIARPYPAPLGIPPLLSAEVCHPSRWRHALGRGTARFSGPAIDRFGDTVLIALGTGAAALAVRAEASVPGARIFVVETADDAAFVAAALQHDVAPGGDELAGEQLSVPERLVVSPAAGRFAPHDAGVDGGRVHTLVRAGQVLGTVGEYDVQSRFSGRLMGMLAQAGERVTEGQPIAWIRV